MRPPLSMTTTQRPQNTFLRTRGTSYHRAAPPQLGPVPDEVNNSLRRSFGAAWHVPLDPVIAENRGVNWPMVEGQLRPRGGEMVDFEVLELHDTAVEPVEAA